MKNLVRRTGFGLVGRGLRKTFRRVEWIGSYVPPPQDSPVVVYANHHVFQDGYALGYFLERVRGRRIIVWVQEFDRFPFLGLVGAMPFPTHDADERFRTMRETVRRMRSNPATALIYFPEGRLHPAEDGLAPFDSDRMRRLARAMPEAWWWPVALRVTGWNEAHPSLLLAGGSPHRAPTGSEAGNLSGLLERLERFEEHESVTILDGKRGPDERWDFSTLRPILPKP